MLHSPTRPHSSPIRRLLNDRRLHAPVLLWTMLYANINSGPWHFDTAMDSSTAFVHGTRAAFPMVVLLIAPFILRHQAARAPFPRPLALWTIYAVVAALAGLFSPAPGYTLYWAAAYLAVLATMAAWLRSGQPIQRAVQLNQLTWIYTAAVLVVLLFVARDFLFVSAATGATGYNVARSVDSVSGMAMSRSSGMARFASVPAVLAYVMLWRDRRWLMRLVWGSALLGSAGLVYFMQSRGAMFGLAFALLVVTWILGPQIRAFVLVLLGLCLVATVSEVISPETIQRIESHIQRGQNAEEFRSMTGRVDTWNAALPFILESPIIGWGMESDRAFGLRHTHNTYIYAMFAGGLLGTIPFVGGLFLAWRCALRVQRRRLASRLGHEVGFVQSVGILAFFTVRSIPEVCGSNYAVDLFVMVPAIAYIVLLSKSEKVLR